MSPQPFHLPWIPLSLDPGDDLGRGDLADRQDGASPGTRDAEQARAGGPVELVVSAGPRATLAHVSQRPIVPSVPGTLTRL